MLRALATAAAALALAAPAHGAVVSKPGATTLRFQGEASVSDIVRVSLVDADTNVLFDIIPTNGQTVTPQAPCVLATPPDVKCPRAGITRIDLDTGAGNDSVNSSVAQPVPIPLQITGGSGEDFLSGGNGADMISAGDGGDLLVGVGGADDLHGDAGFDGVTYCCAATPVMVSIDNVANDGTGAGSEGDNVHLDVEDLTGSAGDDTLTGSAHGNVIDGHDGNDTVEGGAGTDHYTLGLGNDTALTRDGNGERVSCGDGSDTVTADDTDEPADCESFQASGALRDLDSDGVNSPGDCNDNDPSIRPGATDTPDDGVDQNCDGIDASDRDRDRDGVARPLDCDDGNAAVRPGATEVYGNAVDEDCNGRADPLQTILNSVLSRFAAGRVTSIRRLGVEDLEPGTRVELRCSGRRCPFARRTFDITTKTRLLDLRRRARLRSLGAGAVLEVRILRDDSIGRVVRFAFRARGLPRATILCKAPSDPTPHRC